MAKRCASSRTRCTRYSASEPRSSAIGTLEPGRYSNSSRLAKRGELDLSAQPSVAAAFWAAWSCGQSAVDDDQVGAAELGDALFVGPVGQSTSHDLFHGPDVVVAQDLSHVEVPVVALLGQAVFEDDHRADVVRALEVTHVEALDAERRLGRAPARRPTPAGPARARCGRSGVAASHGR